MSHRSSVNDVSTATVGKQKGDIRLDNLSPDLLKDANAADVWHEVKNQIALGTMPPDDEEELTLQQTTAVLDGLVKLSC